MNSLSAMLATSGIEHLGLFIAAGILLNLTPGPDVLYILAQGAKSGLRAGSAAALGIVAGCCVHITAAALGVSALLAASSAAFSVLKWLGAAYLAYVGWGMLRAKRVTKTIATLAYPSRAAAVSYTHLDVYKRQVLRPRCLFPPARKATCAR